METNRDELKQSYPVLFNKIMGYGQTAYNEAVGKANYITPIILLRIEFQYSTLPLDESASEKPLYGGLIGP